MNNNPLKPFKKGMVIRFTTRDEVILKASNDRINGEIVTDQDTYSTDFLWRWMDFKFIDLMTPQEAEINKF